MFRKCGITLSNVKYMKIVLPSIRIKSTTIAFTIRQHQLHCSYISVDQSKCSIHSVKLDPCPDGPGFCLLRRGKPYILSFDFTPRKYNFFISFSLKYKKNTTIFLQWQAQNNLPVSRIVEKTRMIWSSKFGRILWTDTDIVVDGLDQTLKQTN